MSSVDKRYELEPHSRRRRSPDHSDEDGDLHAKKRRKSASVSRDHSRTQSPPRRPHRDRSRERRKRHSSVSEEDRPKDRSRDRRNRREDDRGGSRSRSPWKADKGRERNRDGRITKELKRRRSRSHSRSRDRDRNRARDRHRERSRDHQRHRRRADGSDSEGSPNRRSHRAGRRRPHSSRSPRRQRSSSRSPIRKRAPLPSQNDSFQSTNNEVATRSDGSAAPAGEKQKPNFNTTGLLAREANRVEGTNISLKYHEPPEARKPPASNKWSLLIFKGSDHLGTTELWTRSCWLVGRENKVCDLLAEHGSISGQHAVIQFRWVLKKRKADAEAWEDKQKGKVKPYIIDLDSVNGTILNGEPIEKSRYFELRSGDVVKFGQSEREYVIMLPPVET